MAFQTEALNPEAVPMQQELLDKHYLRKHGKNAHYGQGWEAKSERPITACKECPRE